jgi:hypothetical protein
LWKTEDPTGKTKKTALITDYSLSLTFIFLGGRVRRIKICGQLDKKLARPYLKKKKKPNMEAHVCNISYAEGRDRKTVVQGQPR